MSGLQVFSPGRTFVIVSFAWHEKKTSNSSVSYILTPEWCFISFASVCIQCHLSNKSVHDCIWMWMMNTSNTWKKMSRRIQVWRGKAAFAVNACSSPSTICTCTTISPEDQDIVTHFYMEIYISVNNNLYFRLKIMLVLSNMSILLSF